MEKELWEMFKTIKETKRGWHNTMAEIERIIITKAREEDGQGASVAASARRLGMARTTLVMKVKKWVDQE